MMGVFVKNQFKTLYGTLKNKSDAISIAAMFLFLILNALKLTLFNYYIVQNQSADIFKYKLEMSLLLIAIVYPVIFKFGSRAVLLTVYLLQALYILVNIAYYLYFHSYLHIMQWIMLFGEAFTATRNFAVPKSPQLLIAFIDLPLFVYIVLKYKKVTVLRFKLRFFIRVAAIISLCVVFSLEANCYLKDRSIPQLLKDRYSGESPIVERYGTVVNNLVSIYLSRGDKELVNQLQYGKDQTNAKEVQNRPNFVIIQVESMDANVINQRYKGNYIAPFLHSLSNESIYYPYTLSYHMGGGTSDSEFSIIDSVQPLEGFPAMKLANYDYPNSMVSRLSNSSYDTMAFHGNVGSFFNRDVAFPRIGFREFYDLPKMNLKQTGWGASDGDVFNYVLNDLKSVKQSFFSYVITMTSHGPFTNAGNCYNNSLYDDIENVNVRNYFNSMSYVDKSIEDFVAGIESNFKDTYIFIWGDHAPAINTDLYKQASFTVDNRYFEFVPLIIVTPDKKVYREDKNAASFLDIAPTILNASGIKFEIKSDGHDLINSSESVPRIPFKGGSYDRAFLFEQFKK